MHIETIIKKINLAGPNFYKDEHLQKDYQKLKNAATDTIQNWSRVIISALKESGENWEFKEAIINDKKYFVLINLDKDIYLYEKLLNLSGDVIKQLNDMAIKKEIMIMHSTDNPIYSFTKNAAPNTTKITLLSLNRRKNIQKDENSIDIAIKNYINKRFEKLSAEQNF